MAFLERLRSVFGKPQSTPQASSASLASMSPEDLAQFLRVGMETHSGAVVNESSAMKVAAAWRCVNIIARTIGSLPMDLIRRVDEDTREPAVGHPLRRVLTVKPNQWQTPSEFRRMLQAHLLLRGNGYARKVRTGRRVVALLPLHPDRVTVEQMPDLTLRYTVSRRNGSPLVLPQDEIMHLRGLSLDGVTGLSVLSYMREALGLALQTEQASARMMKNGAFGTRTLTHPGRLGAQAAQNLRDSVSADTEGVENSGKLLVLEEGMKLEALAMTARDAQFLESRSFQRYDIAMFFGVPPHMLGSTEKSTSWGSGIEQQGIGFVTYTLQDWITTWQEAIKRDLMDESEWDTLDARVFTQGLLRGDANSRWNTYVRGLQWGVYSPDEVRRFEDENPRADGRGGVYYDPPNTAGTSSEQSGEQNEPAQPAED